MMSDSAIDLHTGKWDISASSLQEHALANPDLAEISLYSGKEDPQTMRIVADDSSDPEVPIPDTQRHGTCFAGDVDHNIQAGLKNIASETEPERDLENISYPQENLLDTQECFPSECCIESQDQGQESPSETGSADPMTESSGPLPCRGSTQDVIVGVQDSPSMDLTDQENCLDVSPESMVPFSMSLHETPQADLEIAPPLPPLPPTQWWMGKLVESVKTTETQFSSVPSLAVSGNYIHTDGNTENGSVPASEAKYPSEALVTAGEYHSFHVCIEESTVEAVSTATQTTLNEPSKATEEQFPSAVDGTSNTYMHIDESTNKTAEESFASVSLVTAQAAPDAETAEDFEADWRVEAMALEWFSQNLREQTNPNPAKSEEEPQLDHPLKPPGETELYDENEKVGKLPGDKDSLVIGIDRSMLRKVSERNETQVGARVDENDSLLELIRSKSFNLRPADASVRPNFQVAVPITNLKVAAILEKANTLRQAMAGSDDEHDSDSWSE